MTILLQIRPDLRNTQERNTCTYEVDKQETTPENKLKVAKREHEDDVDYTIEGLKNGNVN